MRENKQANKKIHRNMEGKIILRLTDNELSLLGKTQPYITDLLLAEVAVHKLNVQFRSKTVEKWENAFDKQSASFENHVDFISARFCLLHFCSSNFAAFSVFLNPSNFLFLKRNAR